MFLLFYRVVSVPQPRRDVGRTRLVLGNFGVILRVDVFAQADGQDHPQQLSIKHKHRRSAKMFDSLQQHFTLFPSRIV